MRKVIPGLLTLIICLSFIVSSGQDSTRYKYFLGTNFDFIDGLQAQKLYHHVSIAVPKAFTLEKGFIKKIGFLGGIYQTRQVSNTDTVNYLNRGNLREQVAYPSSNPANIRIVLVDSAYLQKTTSTNALGAYLQPTFLLTDSTAETTLSFLGHMEYTRRTIQQKYMVSSKAVDTLTIPKSDLPRYPSIPGNQTTKQTQDEGYFGVGLMIYHKNKFVEIVVKGILGMATLDKWRPFYALDASIMVVKGNFELGVSYKGLFPNYPPYFLNVHLTKVFYLDEIGKLIQ
jgi:hypothetical protein